jgi:hypothetical protein
MQVTNVTFGVPLPGADPRWVLRIDVEGSGFRARAIPFVASVGNVPVEVIAPKMAGAGFLGLLSSYPNDGDELKVGYLDEGLISTGLTYQTPPLV